MVILGLNFHLDILYRVGGGWESWNFLIAPRIFTLQGFFQRVFVISFSLPHGLLQNLEIYTPNVELNALSTQLLECTLGSFSPLLTECPLQLFHNIPSDFLIHFFSSLWFDRGISSYQHIYYLRKLQQCRTPFGQYYRKNRRIRRRSKKFLPARRNLH